MSDQKEPTLDEILSAAMDAETIANRRKDEANMLESSARNAANEAVKKWDDVWNALVRNHAQLRRSNAYMTSRLGRTIEAELYGKQKATNGEKVTEDLSWQSR